MWYTATVAAPAVEPVTIGAIKGQVSAEDFSDDDEKLVRAGKAARAHVEKYCATRFAERVAVTLMCDSFNDFARLPEGPVLLVSSIGYVDTSGADQIISPAVYEWRADGVEAAIVLKYNQSWPATQPGSRITVTANIGYSAAPEDVQQAILALAGHYYLNREAVNVGDIVTALPLLVADLLSNHRRGV